MGDAERLHRDRTAERGGSSSSLVRAVHHRSLRNSHPELGEPRLRCCLVKEDRSIETHFAVDERGAGRRTPRIADRRATLDRGERLPHAGERCDAALNQLSRPLLREILRERGRDRPLGPGRAHGTLECVDRRLPVRIVTAVGARKVDDEHARVEAVSREGGERLGQRGLVAPTEGVVVERIGNGDEGMHGGADRGGVRRREVGEHQSGVFDGVGEHRRLAPRAAHRAEPGAAQGAVHVKQLQRFEQLRNAVHAGEPEPAQERIRTGVGSSDGRGMGEVRGPSSLRTAGLHDHYRHGPLAGLARERLETRYRVEPFDVQPNCAHPLVVEQGRGQTRDPELRLVAGGNQVGDGQPPAAALSG